MSTATRRIRRPSSAYKLLTALLYSEVAPLEALDGPRMLVGGQEGQRGLVVIPSIRRLARLLGTDSTRLNGWLLFLEQQGYITGLSWTPDRRSARLVLVRPRNI